MSKRNWVAINELENYHFRVLVATTDDAEILAGLERGFPELFLAGEEAPLYPVPLSVVQSRAREFSMREYPDEKCWQEDQHFILCWGTCDDLDIPTAFTWDADNEEIPPEILQQFMGQRAQAGMTVVIDDRRYLVWFIAFKVGEEIKPGDTFESPPKLDRLDLVDADFVDLES